MPKNPTMLMFAVILIAGANISCTQPNKETEYCKSRARGEEKSNLLVDNLYVLGTQFHGSIAIDPTCAKPAYSFVNIVTPADTASGPRGLSFELQTAMYRKVHEKSGMYKLTGAVDISTVKKQVTLLRADNFNEVSEAESRAVLAKLFNEI